MLSPSQARVGEVAERQERGQRPELRLRKHCRFECAFAYPRLPASAFCVLSQPLKPARRRFFGAGARYGHARGADPMCVWYSPGRQRADKPCAQSHLLPCEHPTPARGAATLACMQEQWESRERSTPSLWPLLRRRRVYKFNMFRDGSNICMPP